MTGDEELEAMRARITEIDRSIIDAFNRRLEIVEEIKRHKDLHGIAFLDPDRETAMVEQQLAANTGPLSAAGLRALYAELLALTKRELG